MGVPGTRGKASVVKAAATQADGPAVLAARTRRSCAASYPRPERRWLRPVTTVCVAGQATVARVLDCRWYAAGGPPVVGAAQVTVASWPNTATATVPGTPGATCTVLAVWLVTGASPSWLKAVIRIS